MSVITPPCSGTRAGTTTPSAAGQSWTRKLICKLQAPRNSSGLWGKFGAVAALGIAGSCDTHTGPKRHFLHTYSKQKDDYLGELSGSAKWWISFYEHKKTSLKFGKLKTSTLYEGGFPQEPEKLSGLSASKRGRYLGKWYSVFLTHSW